MAHALIRGAAFAALLAGAACAAVPAPALRLDTTPAGDAELDAAAARLAGASSVRLSREAFRARAELSLEPAPRRTLDGLDQGRRTAPPRRLRLERVAGGCRLVDVDSGAEVRLEVVRCEAVPTP